MSIYLFERSGNTFRRIASRVCDAGTLFLFVDYDGTIVPIRKTPREATLPPGIRALLRRLNRHEGTTVGVVTGRSLGSIRKMLHLRDIVIGASHGFEILAGGRHWIHPEARKLRAALAKLSGDLRGRLRHIPRVLVENKRTTLTVHYRNVPSPLVRDLRKTVVSLVRLSGQPLVVTNGKKVIEIRPRVSWGKGHAVNRIVSELDGSSDRMTIYCGDDTTDEDVFRRLSKDAVTVRVGHSRATNARYHVRDVRDVHRFLRMIDRERRHRFPVARRS